MFRLCALITPLVPALALLCVISPPASAHDATIVCSAPPEDEFAELIYQPDDITLEGAQTAIAFLQDEMPDWIETDARRMDDEEVGVLTGETGMAYWNHTNYVRAFVLKADALTAPEEEAADKRAAFCDFLTQNAIID